MKHEKGVCATTNNTYLSAYFLFIMDDKIDRVYVWHSPLKKGDNWLKYVHK